jgi:tetratricopeptide (TPR) repeat protein
MRPDAATALARTGNLRAAAALIARTPLDCTLCLRTRGSIASMQKDWKRADTWFARAVAFGPSFPDNDLAWGVSLLHRGDFSGAAAKFESAHKKSPHYADPLEMWGEVLMLQNRSDLALAKFEEASHYAPNWGRLHLRWGEAMAYVGKKEEAQKQFALAATLWLTPSEKSERVAMKAKHG